MVKKTPTQESRCLFGPDDMEQMRRKFDEECNRLGVFHEDDKARQALGRAVVRSFETGLADPEKPKQPEP